MRIIRNSGNVTIQDTTGTNTIKIVPVEAVIDVIDSRYLQLKFGQELFRLDSSEVKFTKTKTGPVTAFAGDAQQLATILTSIFTVDDPTSLSSDLADIEAALDLANWELTPGNSKEVTYYSGVVPGANPSGNKNIETIVYKTGATPILTYTFTWDADDDLVTEVIS